MTKKYSMQSDDTKRSMLQEEHRYDTSTFLKVNKNMTQYIFNSFKMNHPVAIPSIIRFMS